MVQLWQQMQSCWTEMLQIIRTPLSSLENKNLKMPSISIYIYLPSQFINLSYFILPILNVIFISFLFLFLYQNTSSHLSLIIYPFTPYPFLTFYQLFFSNDISLNPYLSLPLPLNTPINPTLLHIKYYDWWVYIR